MDERIYDVFNFLVEEFGLRKGSVGYIEAYAGGESLCFESNEIRATIVIDYRGEVDAILSRIQGEPEEYSICHILSFLGVKFQGLTFSSKENVPEALQDLAELLKEYATPWLRNDHRTYQALSEFTLVSNGLYTQSFTKQRRPESLWTPIMKAFDAKEYEKLIGLIETLPAPLTNYEKKAIEYSKKQLSSC